MFESCVYCFGGGFPIAHISVHKDDREPFQGSPLAPLTGEAFGRLDPDEQGSWDQPTIPHD